MLDIRLNQLASDILCKLLHYLPCDMSMEAKMSSKLFSGSSFFGLRVWRR